MQEQHLDGHALSVGLDGGNPSGEPLPATVPETLAAGRAMAEPQHTPGWLRGADVRILVAGMAALAVLALVYPEARRREISAAAESIHQCDLGAARLQADSTARAQAREHCHRLRLAYTEQYGHEP